MTIPISEALEMQIQSYLNESDIANRPSTVLSLSTVYFFHALDLIRHLWNTSVVLCSLQAGPWVRDLAGLAYL